jgi:CHRD domain
MRSRLGIPVIAAAGAITLAATGAASTQPTERSSSQAQDRLENRALFAVMTGRKEVDTEGRKGAGDPDGRGSFTATVDGDQLCFGMTVKNIETPAAAHVHRGRSNQAGPIVVPLTPPSSGDPGASSGCVTVDESLLRAILRNPHKYYANVHTPSFGGGAVRGQLFRRSN